MITNPFFYPFRATEHFLLRCYERGITHDLARCLLRKVKIQSGDYSICFLPSTIEQIKKNGVYAPNVLLNEPLVFRLNKFNLITIYQYQAGTNYKFKSDIIFIS